MDLPTGIEHLQPESAPQKLLRNGQFLIIKGGESYTLIGQRMCK
jgi:hypothetical protein